MELIMSADRVRFTILVTAPQRAFLEQQAQQDSQLEGQQVSLSELVRRAFANYYGDDWPSGDLSWGDWSRARAPQDENTG